MNFEVQKVLKQLNLEGEGWRVQSLLEVLGYETKFFFKTYLNEVQCKQIAEYFYDNPKRIVSLPEIAMVSPSYTPEEGDIIMIPDVFLLKSNGTSSGSYVYALVRGKNGEERSISFFPSMLRNSPSPLEKGASQSLIMTKGTASELFCSVDNIEEGLNLLKGKKIHVVKVDLSNFKDAKTQEQKTLYIYQLDLVAEQKSNADILIANRDSCSETTKWIESDYYLKRWDSFPIDKKLKKLAIELVQNRKFVFGEQKKAEITDIFGEELSSNDIEGLKDLHIHHYGCDVHSVDIIQKGNCSFIMYKSKEENHYKICYYTYIVPLYGKVEDVLIDYDDRNDISYKEFIITNERGQHGVFDIDGKNILSFKDSLVSFVEPVLCSYGSNRNLYLVKDKVTHSNSLYYKNLLLFYNVRFAIPYFIEDKHYLVLGDYQGWQVYDFNPWLNNEISKPVSLLKHKLEYDGKKPIPLYLSENMMGIQSESRYGFIHLPTGRLIIPCIYNEIISEFENGKAKVGIDTLGNYVIIDSKNTILGWGNTVEEEREKEENRKRQYHNSNVGDWSFAHAEMEDFKDNWDPN